MFSLYNKQTGKYLTIPKTGLWLTADLSEAEDMLHEFQRYLQSEQITADLEVRFVSPDENSLSS